jgi:hypothetical protein
MSQTTFLHVGKIEDGNDSVLCLDGTRLFAKYARRDFYKWELNSS